MAGEFSKVRAVGSYLPWRRRLADAQAREFWREAVRLNRYGAPHLATDENCPAPVAGVKVNPPALTDHRIMELADQFKHDPIGFANAVLAESAHGAQGEVPRG